MIAPTCWGGKSELYANRQMVMDNVHLGRCETAYGKGPQRQYYPFGEKGEKCMNVFTLEIKAIILATLQNVVAATPTWRKSSVSVRQLTDEIRKVRSFEPHSNMWSR